MGDSMSGGSAFSERLRHERARLGLTQTEFAKRAGITVRSQRNYESGARQPNSTYISALMSMGVDIGYVLDDLRAEVAEQHESLIMLALEVVSALGYGKGEGGTYADQLVEAALVAHELDRHSRPEGLKHLEHLMGQIVANGPIVITARNSTVSALVDLDCYMLADIIEGLERQLDAMNRRASPSQKALRIARLYQQFSETGKFDPEMLEAAARSIPAL